MTELASWNDEVKRLPPLIPEAKEDDHSHLDMNEKGMRWELVVDTEVPSECLDETIKPVSLAREIQSLKSRGVTFVSTEHWFPRDPIPDNVKLVTVLREPLDRVLSSYYFHGCGKGRRCPHGAKSCPFGEWHVAEANMYTRMLNGLAFGPVVMNWPCHQAYLAMPLGEEHYQHALGSLQRFNVVLTLETLQQKPAVAMCALHRVLGWNASLEYPRSNVGKRQCTPVAESEVEAARDAHSLDIRLYEEAKKLEQQILIQLNCQEG